MLGFEYIEQPNLEDIFSKRSIIEIKQPLFEIQKLGIIELLDEIKNNQIW
jgi:hypothetical protein